MRHVYELIAGIVLVVGIVSVGLAQDKTKQQAPTAVMVSTDPFPGPVGLARTPDACRRSVRSAT